MKIKSTKTAQDPHTLQGVNQAKSTLQGPDGAALDPSQEFKGLMATFAGAVGHEGYALPLETFQVEPLSPTSLIQEPQRAILQGPSDAQISLQAGATTAPTPTDSNAQLTEESLDQSTVEDKENPPAPMTADDHSSRGSTSEDTLTSVNSTQIEKTDDLQTAATNNAEATLSGEHAVSKKLEVQTPHTLDLAKSSSDTITTASEQQTLSATASMSASDTPKIKTEEAELSAALAKMHSALAPQEGAPDVLTQHTPATSAVAALLTRDLIHSMAQSAGLAGAASSTNDSATRQIAATTASVNTNMIHAAGSISAGRGSSHSEPRTARPLPPAAASQALERVEQTLKEVARSKDGKSISLHLNPSELGHVKVDVTLREGILHARLAAENPQVAQLLRERAQDLQATLRKLGLNVDTISVAVQGDGQSFGQLDQNLGGRNWQGPSDNGRSLGNAQIGANPIVRGISEMISNPHSALDHWVA